MKYLKKRVSILVVLVVLLTCIPNQSFALDNGNNSYTITHTLEDGTEVTDTVTSLSYDEAVNLLVQKKGITLEEAREVLAPSIMRSVDATSYSSRSRTYNWGGYTVEIGGIWLVYSEGSFREFREFRQAWTGATGSGTYTWNEFYVSDMTTSYPTTHAYIEGRGTLEVAISKALTTSVGADLLAANFGVAGTVGETVYYRRTETIYFDWNLYA